jgi:hypothetical protein
MRQTELHQKSHVAGICIVENINCAYRSRSKIIGTIYPVVMKLKLLRARKQATACVLKLTSKCKSSHTLMLGNSITAGMILQSL